MKCKLFIAIIGLLSISSCSTNKLVQGKISQDIKEIANLTGSRANDSLFRLTVVTQSNFSEYISLYNIEKPAKEITKEYVKNLRNYLTLLDSVKNSIQPTSLNYQNNFSKSMRYIIVDIKDKSTICKNCKISDNQPSLITLSIQVSSGIKHDLFGYKAYMKPAVTKSNNATISLHKAIQEVTNKVVPGYYIVWIEKSGKIVKERAVNISNQSKKLLLTFEI